MKGYFSSSTIKIIAVCSMVIDHMALCIPWFWLNPDLYTLMRQIGRIAFPIFCFCIVQGYFHTSDVKKYILRLFIFALISEIPFDLATGTFDSGRYFSHQNVFFTLCIGLIAVYMIDSMSDKVLFQIYAVAASCILARVLKTDYNMYGVIQILIFYYFRNRRAYRIAGIILLNTLMGQPFGAVSLVFTELYNNKRGLKLKYILYAFYPVQFMVLYLINML